MAVPLLDEPADDDPADAVAGLIEELRRARGRPETALRRAAPLAAAIAPAVIDLVDRAAGGVYLTPRQSNLLFWGVHVLAAGRRSELCAPLLRMLRSIDRDLLDEFFGDAMTATFKGVFVSIFDGNGDALIEAIADQRVDSYVRWGLFNALARVTFDGAISRERTLDFLDRFERERLAPPLDPAWEGWMEAVIYLRVEQLHDRLRQAWHDGLFDDTISGLQHWEREIAVVSAMRPDDTGLLDREGLAAITDINRLLGWVSTEEDLAKRDARDREGDPAAHILPAHEREWLRGFLSSKHAPATSMTIEQLDGYFTALAVCSSDVEPNEHLPALWNYDAEGKAGPSYDNEEQAEYVSDLLGRYQEAVERRIAAGFPHPRKHLAENDDAGKRDWAAGFLRGVVLQADAWKSRAQVNKDCATVTTAAYLLVAGASGDETDRLSRRNRTRFFRVLPRLLLNAYRGWRGLLPIKPSPVALAQESTASLSTYGQTPIRVSRKIGRNEPCPCGSGKKYKRCCGKADD
jgi:yecA family protein